MDYSPKSISSILIRADLLFTLCPEILCSAKPAQVGADYPRANDRTIFWPMLAHTADRQQLGSSPGFTFQEVGVCVVPMNQEETRSLEIFDIVYCMALQIVEFSSGGYKIRKIFA